MFGWGGRVFLDEVWFTPPSFSPERKPIMTSNNAFKMLANAAKTLAWLISREEDLLWQQHREEEERAAWEAEVQKEKIWEEAEKKRWELKCEDYDWCPDENDGDDGDGWYPAHMLLDGWSSMEEKKEWEEKEWRWEVFAWETSNNYEPVLAEF
jgi:hypothetical protein